MSAALQLPVSPIFQPEPSRADRGTTASATQPTAPTGPAPQPGQPTRARTEPRRIVRVITIVRWLIGYGTLLLTAVREHPTEPLAQSIAYWCHTPDLGVLLRRLTRGLMRAAALEAWLRERAASGRDLRETPMRWRSGKPRSAPPDAPRGGHAKPAPWWQDPDHVPTQEEAAAEVRTRPEGAVISDICDDLRFLDCEYDYATWHELKDAIDRYGGDHAGLVIRDLRRKFNPSRLKELFLEEPPPPWRAPPLSGWTPGRVRPP